MAALAHKFVTSQLDMYFGWPKQSNAMKGDGHSMVSEEKHYELT